jgi:hypothetical protein
MKKRETPTPSIKTPISEHTSNLEQTNITRERSYNHEWENPKKPYREKTSLKASNENPEVGWTRLERYTFFFKKRGSKTLNPGKKNSNLDNNNFETKTMEPRVYIRP